MAINASQSWIPSSLNAFNYTDCDSAKYFYNTVLLNQTNDFPIFSTLDLLKDGLSHYWSINNITTPNASELLGGFVGMIRSNNSFITDSIGQFVDNNITCYNELCQSLAWQGNSDQAGRGMLATYCIEATLVTVYLLVLGISHMPWGAKTGNPRNKQTLKRTVHSPLWSSVLEATQESFRPFLDAALFFCLAMQIAAMAVFIRPRRHPANTVTISSAIMAAFTALFTIFPALALSSGAFGNLRRARLRAFTWFLIALFNIVTFILFIPSKYIVWHVTFSSLTDAAFKDKDNQVIWEGLCLERAVVERYTWAFMSMFILLWSSIIFYLVIIQGLLRYLHLRERLSPKRYRTLRQLWSSISATLSGLAMWAALGVFEQYRKEMSKRTGDTNKDHEWTFGQILSVFTFVAVVVEFLLVYHFGAEIALSGLVSHGFKVVRDDAGRKVTNDKTTDGSKV
ncbi:hypothetical protein BDV96DRAFT_653150 [Lophiotrema nucula]|uniref:Uncharacterized protein n=1 Tax=Lophiotrema nucula TaxID=690887 RepID=A0A6A5YMG4_9PLEO|nr:hypothetical protein BDV96DRAFT_653150 [Lophiotrema nucula]